MISGSITPKGSISSKGTVQGKITSSTGNVSGNSNIPTKGDVKDYTGLTTDTAETIVDNTSRTIKVNVIDGCSPTYDAQEEALVFGNTVLNL